MNNEENMDFDFTEDSQDTDNSIEQSDGESKKTKKPKRKFGLTISNKYIRNLLIYAVLCLIVTILIIVFVKPRREPVPDNRVNTKCEDSRVFDNAMSMSIGEREELQSKIDEYQNKLKFDIVIATVNLIDPSTLRNEGKKIYGNGDFGWDKPSGDGLILIYETQTDSIELVTYGRLVDLIDGSGLKKLSKSIRNESNTTYFLKSMSFLSSLSNSINSSGKSPALEAALEASWEAAFVSLIMTIIMVLVYKRNRSKNLNKEYLASGANSRIQYDEKSDTLVNSVKTSRKIQKSNSKSSGGGTRTGGGSL